VQVRKEWADTIIDALNGKIFRGRPLTVNHARTKSEESSAADGLNDTELEDAEAEQTSTMDDYSYSEENTEAPDSGEETKETSEE